jgi:hypothetical protein
MCNLFTASTSSDEHILLPSPVNDNIVDNSINEPSLHVKRASGKEVNERSE